MRMRGKCAIFTLCCFSFVVLNNLVKFLYFNYIYFPTSSTKPQTQQIYAHQSRQNLDLFLRRRCRVDNLRNCIQNLNTRSWVGIEIPIEEEYPLDDLPEGVKDLRNKGANPRTESFPDAKNTLSQNVYEFEASTPEGFVEVSKKNPIKQRKKKKKKKFSLGHFSLNSPHAPEKLRNRLESFPKNSEILKFVKKQDDRRVFQNEYCSRKLNSSGQNPFNYNALDTIIVDREYCLTFCPIYKAASTSWLVNLLTLKGMWKNTKQIRNVQRLVNQVFQKVSTLVAPWVSRGTTKFMIVRHPFQRLISCYRDKFEEASKLYYYDRYGEKMVRAFRPRPPGVSRDEVFLMIKAVRKSLANAVADVSFSLKGNPYANPIGPTFEEFVKYVVSSKYDDDHWRPFYLQCSLCHISYDFVLRFENINSDSKLFAEYLNQSSVIKTGWKNPTADGTTTEAVVCNYFKKINMSLMEKLIAKYKDDFELFHYTPDEFRKCVKDYKR